MKGSITDTYTVVPNDQGRYPIPAVSFSYFDLKSEAYKTIKSNELVVSVIGSSGVTPNGDSNTKEVQKTNVTALSKQFFSFKSNADLEPIAQNTFYNTKLFWWLFLGPLLLIPLLIIFTRKQEKRAMDVAGNKTRKTNKLARKYFGSAKRAIGEKEAFYVALERALHNYLKSRLKIETSEFSKEKIALLLEKRGVNQLYVQSFLDIIESCELARYTPLQASDMTRAYKKSIEVINTLDKQLK
jgi:magnesium-transporting ATPase (P-type)